MDSKMIDKNVFVSYLEYLRDVLVKEKEINGKDAESKISDINWFIDLTRKYPECDWKV